MAKALLGHVGGTDLRMLAEVRRLQQRVRDLEAEVLRLRAEGDALATASIVSVPGDLTALEDTAPRRSEREFAGSTA